MKIPDEAKNLLEKDEVFLGTCSGRWPNVTVTESGVIIGPEEFLICDCMMTLAKDNIIKNPNCSFSVYNTKSQKGYKAFGKAKYYNKGKYLEIAKKRLSGESFKAKGAIVIKIDKIFQIE